MFLFYFKSKSIQGCIFFKVYNVSCNLDSEFRTLTGTEVNFKILRDRERYDAYNCTLYKNCIH